jgi:very-short-patch-repair endonuclease
LSKTVKKISYYPLLYIPNDYVSDNYKGICNLIIQKPKYEVIEPKTNNEDFSGNIIIVIFVFSFIACFRDPIFYIPIWSLALFLVILFYSQKSKEENKKYNFLSYSIKQRNEKLRLEYENMIVNKNIFKGISLLNTDNERKRILMLKAKNKSLDIKISQTNFNRIGYTENVFFKILTEHFGAHLINNNLKINGYTPDFVYMDENKSIFLIIEIDEPYIIDTREPIHYEDIDDLRNESFLEINYSILRFAEIQIFKEPQNCLKTIQSAINLLENKTTEFINFNEEVKKWTYEESKIWSKENFRENYLGIKKFITNSNNKRYENDDLDLENLPF